MEPILVEIESVDWDSNTATVKLPQDILNDIGNYWLVGKYYLVPKGNYVIAHKDALVDGGVRWIG